MISVTVYSTGDHCQRCRLTVRRLDDDGIRYRVVELGSPHSADAREYITHDLGYSEAPVVVVDQDPQNHWSGFRPDLIDRLAAAPHGGVG